MKPLITGILAAVMLLSLCACAQEAPAATPSTSATVPSPTDAETSPSTTVSQPAATVPSAPAPTETQPTQPPTQPQEPTAEEIKAMWEYAHIASALKDYLKNNYIIYTIYDENQTPVKTLRDQEALQYCYQQLVAMESIDRWIGTEYTKDVHWRDEIPVWDRQGLLKGFSVLRDLKLRQDHVTVKKDGSTESGTESAWSYDTDGKLIAIDGIRAMFEQVQSVPVFPGNFEIYFSYNADGNVSQILYGSNAYATAIPTYGANGKISGMAVTSRDDSCTVTYSYSGDLVTKISWTEYGNPVDIEYTYDGNGNVIRSVYTSRVPTDNLGNNVHIHQRIIFEYTYSGDRLVSATRTEENWNWEWDENMNYVFFPEVKTVDTYTFAYDAQGRLATVDISFGNSMWVHGDKAGSLCREAEFRSKHIAMIYGDYCFYHG